MRLRLFLFALYASLSVGVWAQIDTVSTRSIYVGLRNNKYVFAGYQGDSWSVGLENTLWIRNPNEQYLRLNGRYSLNTKLWDIQLSAHAFAGANYAGRYYDGGLKVGLDCRQSDQYPGVSHGRASRRPRCAVQGPQTVGAPRALYPLKRQCSVYSGSGFVPIRFSVEIANLNSDSHERYATTQRAQ